MCSNAPRALSERPRAVLNAVLIEQALLVVCDRIIRVNKIIIKTDP